MRKIRLYIIFYGIVLCISVMGIIIGVGFAKIQELHLEYLSIGIVKGIIVFGVALWLSMCLHEITHAVAYRLQGIAIRLIYLFPVCLIKEARRYKISVALNLQLGFGGIVIPQISSVLDEKEYNTLREKISISVISASIFSALLGILFLLLVSFTIRHIKYDVCSYYFIFCIAMVFWSVYINITSILNLGSIVGDYIGAKKLKTDEVYSLVQIYNYFLLQDNILKENVRTTQSFLIERMRQCVETLTLDINAPTMNFLLADAFLYEMIMKPKCYSSVLADPENLNSIIYNIQERIPFEIYSCFCCHAIIYLNLIGDSEEALMLWEKYSERITKTKSGIYRFKQTEMAVYKRTTNVCELNEKIELSSMDSLLSKLPNYYDDEKIINNFLIVNPLC